MIKTHKAKYFCKHLSFGVANYLATQPLVRPSHTRIVWPVGIWPTKQKGFTLKKKYIDQVVEWSKTFVVSLSQKYSLSQGRGNYEKD